MVGLVVWQFDPDEDDPKVRTQPSTIKSHGLDEKFDPLYRSPICDKANTVGGGFGDGPAEAAFLACLWHEAVGVDRRIDGLNKCALELVVSRHGFGGDDQLPIPDDCRGRVGMERI